MCGNGPLADHRFAPVRTPRAQARGRPLL